MHLWFQVFPVKKNDFFSFISVRFSDINDFRRFWHKYIAHLKYTYTHESIVSNMRYLNEETCTPGGNGLTRHVVPRELDFSPQFRVNRFLSSNQVETHARTHARTHTFVFTPRARHADPRFPCTPFAFSADIFFFFIANTLTNLRNCGSRSDSAFFFRDESGGQGIEANHRW